MVPVESDFAIGLVGSVIDEQIKWQAKQHLLILSVCKSKAYGRPGSVETVFLKIKQAYSAGSETKTGLGCVKNDRYGPYQAALLFANSICLAGTIKTR